MKVILTGATGQIGSEVLTQLISHPSITRIIVLQRRELPPSAPSSTKINVVIHKDFLSYSPEILKEFEGAEACIWAQGGVPWKFPTVEIAKEVNITYPLTFCQAVVPFLQEAMATEGKKFKMVYVSGYWAERYQEKKLRMFSDGRKIKGEIENKLLEFKHSSQNSKVFEPIFARVGGVIPPGSKVIEFIGTITSPLNPAIRNDEFAAALIDLVIIESGKGMEIGVVEGGEGEGVVEHEVMKRRGREILDVGRMRGV
ncbi:hypothetical protein BGZ60DRAFT_528956 [Tricladium varicosporioides]|nr:hypothetical protein BGZ60DRAFT_528956 [Hymenoscyphus varicosporioides]